MRVAAPIEFSRARDLLPETVTPLCERPSPVVDVALDYVGCLH